MTEGSTGGIVRWLHDSDAEDIDATGGKGANLATLAQAGLPVPPGFVVTTTAYRALVDTPEIRDAIRRLDALDSTDTDALATAAAELRSLIGSREFDGAIETAVADALASFDDTNSFAVRSSATAEDLPSASFAGQHETFLGVASDHVLDRVRNCMASLFTDRAVAYRARSDVDHANAEMAVVVQPMVNATAAGVLFTADPTTGNRHVASVDASFGLGESIVAGDVTPDHALVNSQTDEILEYSIGTKTIAVELHKDGIADKAGGTQRVELPPDRRESRVLTDDQLRTLVAFGEQAERLLGAPQDVEWALADGQFVLLQSRPITSLFPRPSPAPDDDRLHVYISMGHMQAMPEAMPPLVRDVWRTYTGNAFSAAGLDASLGNPTVEAGGRIYIDITPFLRNDTTQSWLIERLAAVNEPISAGLDDIVSRRPKAFKSRGSTVGALPDYVATAGRVARLLGPAVPRIVWNLLSALVGRGPTPDDESWARLSDLFVGEVTDASTPEARARAVFEGIDFGRFLREVYPQVSPLFLAFALGGWLTRTFPNHAEDVNAVGRGFEHDVVTRINLGLGDLADVARTHPPVAKALRGGASLAELENVAGDEVFIEGFEDFLDEFGHRSTGEIDISRPRWREDPSMLLAVVRANLADEARGDHHERIRWLANDAEVAAARLETRADHGLLGPLRRRYVRRLIRTYRDTVYFREYPKQEAARAFTAWRTALLDVGAQLAAKGQLDQPDDVWYLHKNELFAALDGECVDVDIDARRREHARNIELNAPPVLTSEGEVIRGDTGTETAPENALVGTGVSSGVVEGVARVIRDPKTATVERGEILVAPSTDPGWTPLFLNAAGLVSEVGGSVSHGALVAREYGLPAVVSVSDATRRIQTGQRIRIDGTRGTVELLDEDPKTSDEERAEQREANSENRP
ncbi:PEP/pyruvate-binding domain-containing protein [Haloarcula nitratireducens]|uniref:Pyruvate, phosphate dikinase n=1 Tax=Haloarcula nitratireducens TaxID=2487749 RepID=A0AAW4PJX0_9EURY|nr:PEP/pyruvate-binding domain-containing protein [Halomicroarcula nitratireducens]MBX0298283.1 pyruvate, phosphate dikinase [Halomicroarcula nitratireducens]